MPEIRLTRSLNPFTHRAVNAVAAHSRPLTYTRSLIGNVSRVLDKDLGFDDISLVTTMLPNSAGAIATSAAVLPIVAAGAVGAADEFRKHVKDVLPAAKAQMVRDQNEVRELADRVRSGPASGQGRERERLHVQRHVAGDAADRHAALRTGTAEKAMVSAGTAALTVGVATSGASAALEVAGNAAATAVETAAVGIFIPAQVVLGCAALTRSAKGIRHDRELARNARALEAGRDLIGEATMDTVRQHMAQKRKFVRTGEVAGNAVTGLGQFLMAGGGAASLTGVGFLPGGLLAATGICASGLGTVMTISSERKAARADGSRASDEVKAQVAAVDPGRLVEDNGFEGAIGLTAAAYTRAQHEVAEGKLLSLIAHDLRREKPSGVQRSAAERRASVAGMVATGKKSFFKGTTLLKNDLALMQQMFARQPFDVSFFEGSTIDVHARIEERLLSNPAVASLHATEKMQESIMAETANRLDKARSQAARSFLGIPKGLHEKVVNDEQWSRFLNVSPEARVASLVTTSKQLSRQVKEDAKHRRAGDLDLLSLVSRAHQTFPQATYMASTQDLFRTTIEVDHVPRGSRSGQDESFKFVTTTTQQEGWV